ncbi:hypothetical protein ACV1DG_15450, partial [Aeromonas hydrophila]
FHVEPPAFKIRENSTYEHLSFSGGLPTGKPARVLGYHVGDAYAQVGRGRIAVIYTPVWYCYRSSEIADTSGQIEVAQLGDI